MFPQGHRTNSRGPCHPESQSAAHEHGTPKGVREPELVGTINISLLRSERHWLFVSRAARSRIQLAPTPLSRGGTDCIQAAFQFLEIQLSGRQHGRFEDLVHLFQCVSIFFLGVRDYAV
jgi:hypothetical protein